MPTDNHNINAQHIPFQAYLLAPVLAPLTWLLAGVATNLYDRGLSLAGLVMKLLFMLLLLLGSYALCTPLLHIWAGRSRWPQRHGYAGFVLAAITALTMGLLYAQPGFQDARNTTRNLVYLSFMQLTCLGMFLSLKNLFPTTDENRCPASLAWLAKHPSHWSLFSLFKGGLALILVCSVTYANSLIPRFDFSRFFALQIEQDIFPEAAFAASVFDVNPNHFFDWCFYSAIILAVAAMASALQAKIQGEDSLYRATGCICGALALAVFDPRLAVYAGLAYGIAEYVMRLKTR